MTNGRFILRLLGPSDCADEAAFDLVEAGAVAVEQRDPTTMTPCVRADSVELVAGFGDAESREEAVRLMASSWSAVEVFEIAETDESYRNGWREFFKPVILDRLQVVTPWMDAPSEGRSSIVIDPGQAFGTGGHATTRLVLGMLERMAKAQPLPFEVLDIGTGSGILAIAARMLGASNVLGVDIEEDAVAAAVENAKRNRILDGIDFRLGSAGELNGTWPLVLANLQLDVFCNHALDIGRAVGEGGCALLSGILTSQVQECLALWPRGFALEERVEEEEWAALAFRRTT